MYQWCTNGYKWWVFGIYLNSLEGNRISCCVWVTYQNYPKISKVVCKPNSGVLELCFKKNQTYYRKCCFDETDCFAMVASKFKMSRLYKALGSWFRQANSTRENISMYIHLITWMGLSANWIYMDIPQNIIKHPFSKCSNIKHLSNLNQQSSIPLIINQLWHIMIQLIKQQHPSMAPAEPLPGASSSKRRPRGLPEPGRRRAGIRGEFFRIPGAKWQKSGTTIS